MYIGSLVSEKANVGGRYFYLKRDSNLELKPDFQSAERDNSIKNLCDGTIVSWKWDSLMDVGVDIKIELEKECFIDRVILKQDTDSAFHSVEILCLKEQNDLALSGIYQAETNAFVCNPLVTVPVGVSSKMFVLRLNSCFKSIAIESINIIGALFDDNVIFPQPAFIETFNEETINIQELTSIIADDNDIDLKFAAHLLQEKLIESYDVSLPLAIQDALNSKTIVISKADYFEVGKGDARKINDEGYILKVDTDKVNICAKDRSGLLYGIESTLQLIKNSMIRKCIVEDYPRMSIRGVHLGLPAKEQIDFFKRLVRYMFMPMRLNTIFLEFAGGMRYDKHPEINEAWANANKKAKAGEWPPMPHGEMVAGGNFLEKMEVADLVAYAHKYNIEVIPEVQSLSHVQYITVAHPDIAEYDSDISRERELDLRDADKLPSEFYYHSYCPSLEKSYQITFDLIDEIVDVVQPKEYVHMGHDEVYQIGICPRCKSKNPADLYAMHVNKIYDYLSKKGLKMMIWSDMLQPDTQYKTPPAITKLPKDIVMLDFVWYFHLDKDLEDNLLKHGFEVIVGNLYSSHYPRYESRIAKPGVIGAQTSTWCRVDEYTFAREGKMFDILYSSNMMWSSDYITNARYTYEKIIADITPRLRSQLHGKKYPSQSKYKTSTPLSLPDVKRKVPIELKTALAYEGTRVVNNIKFNFSAISNIEEPFEITVGNKYDSIVFLQTMTNNVIRIPWKSLLQVGYYTIKYDDRSEVIVPIEYGGNICVWDRRYAEPMLPGYYRHNGYVATYFSDPYIQTKSLTGKDVTIYGLEWINPFSDKKITSITCTPNDNSDASVILVAVSGINLRKLL